MSADLHADLAALLDRDKAIRGLIAAPIGTDTFTAVLDELNLLAGDKRAAEARVRELEAEAGQHREEVDELATELAEERTLTQELQAERDELREVLRRIRDDDVPGKGDWSDCVQDYARAALRSPAGPSTDEDKP